ncbi:MAG: hypothetical protein JWR22_4127 [Herminiimonas sp.]|nr:hypothetical protein [Herminiimonas sp.]
MKASTAFFAVTFAASLTANVFLFQKHHSDSGDRKFEVQLASPDRIEVMRTKGGLLEVSTLRAPETFQAMTNHRFFHVVSLGNTVTQIRVPAVYRYHIELAPEWKVTVRDKTFIVVAPAVKPTLPIAIDTARLERFASGTWSLLTGRKELDELQRSITQTLAVKAGSSSYIELQREVARKTVKEFVEKWLITQGKWDEHKKDAIKVYFDDEPISALNSGLSTGK